MKVGVSGCLINDIVYNIWCKYIFKLVKVSVICEVDVDKGLLLLLPLPILLPLLLELLMVDVGLLLLLELLDMFDDVFVVICGVYLGDWDDCIIILYIIYYVVVCL